MAFDVFISYSHQDKPTADAACATLEASGIRCWIAPRDIVPGQDWSESIVTAIENAKVMVLIFSGHANESPQIKREVERTVNRGIPILPVRIEDVLPSKSLEYFISTPHWLDAYTPPLESHLKRLAASVHALLDTQSGQASTSPAPATAAAVPPPLPRRMFSRRWQLGASALALAALIVLGIFSYRAYDATPADLVRTIQAGVTPVDSVSISPDSMRIASGSWDSQIRIWDLRSGQAIRSIGAGHSGVAVPFSKDGDWIASGSASAVKIWDPVSGQAHRTFSGHTGKVMSVAFTPDGTRLISTSEDKTIKVWEIESGQLLRTLEGHTNTVSSVVTFPDNKRIASGSHDGTVRVWDATTGEMIFKLTGHTGKVIEVTVSPDGNWIASGGQDGAVRGWDATSGQPLQRIINRSALVTSVAFSPDGKWIVSAAYDGTVAVSDSKSGELKRTLSTPAPLSSVRFSPDGKWIVSGGDDHMIRIWRAP